MSRNIRGFKELDMKLKKAKVGVVKDADRTIKEYAYRMEAQAKALAPVDTGYMRNSVSTKLAFLSATLSVSAKYATYVEFGTSKQTPQPFFYLAFDSLKDELTRTLERQIGRHLS